MKPDTGHETVQLLGAGGHARVVIDALLCCGWSARDVVLRDDRAQLAGTTILGCLVAVPLTIGSQTNGWVHGAMGSGIHREKALAGSSHPPGRWLSVIHPRAVIAGSASLGSGCFVAAQAVIGPCVTVGEAVIVNHGAVVDHDCVVGAFSHIAPLASLSGGVKIGRRVQIGTGARVLPGVHVADDAVVGAGAVVLQDIGAAETWVGVPAKRIS